MHRALELAKKALGCTNPNPMVGAVLVKNGGILGEGYHQKAGTPHAEIHALRQAEDAARGATIYVSLEPCSHFGRTPPCADALVNAGVGRVVIAMKDPNPKVAGQGIRKLQEAGIVVTVGVLEEEARKLNEVFLKHILTQLPFVAIKTAMTMDGKIACESGDSQWITNEASREYVHRLRHIYDAILVGIGTVLKDNPRLNTRLKNEVGRNPIRVVIDTFLDTPMQSNIVKTAELQKTIIFCSDQVEAEKERQLVDAGIEIHKIDVEQGYLPLEKALRILYELGICSVLVEGGGEINGTLVNDRLVDKFYSFIGSKVIGGRRSPTPVGGSGIQRMEDAILLNSIEVQRFGNDVLLISYPEKQ